MTPTDLPSEIRAGLDEVLARAIGVADLTGDHALTWTVFSHLLQTAEAAPCWELLGGSGPWPSALLWGGEALGEQAEYVREQLLEKSPDWAPDVVLEFWPAGLVMVLCRYLKPHPDVPDGAVWDRWIENSRAFFDPVAARQSGRFDLARAWRLGWELAGRRAFTLVSLQLFPEPARQKAATDLFVSSLGDQEDRRFKQLTWRALLAALPQPWPEWLIRFAAEKRLR